MTEQGKPMTEPGERSRSGRVALACLGLFTLIMTALVIYTFAAALH